MTGIEVTWEFRSLAEFNDRPLVEFADDFDLLVVDHPAIAAAADCGALIAFEALLDPERLRSILAGTAGPSAASYRYRESTWALAVDATCQVCAYNPRVVEAPPVDWDGALEFAAAHPAQAAIPLTPADAVCALLSLAATFGESVAVGGEIPLQALSLLRELVPLLHQRSWTSAPPALLRAMDEHDGEIVYLPLTFGYRAFEGPRVRFGDPPASAVGCRASVLGGAGVAVSAQSSDPQLAAMLAAWLSEPEAQTGVILASGGQPAHRSVWETAQEPFFVSTRRSLEQAYTRPAHPAWHEYQRRVGAELHAGLRALQTPDHIATRLQEISAPV